ncbi:hypothetical protein ACLOJK_015423 [Asimina triloba]
MPLWASLSSSSITTIPLIRATQWFPLAYPMSEIEKPHENLHYPITRAVAAAKSTPSLFFSTRSSSASRTPSTAPAAYTSSKLTTSLDCRPKEAMPSILSASKCGYCPTPHAFFATARPLPHQCLLPTNVCSPIGLLKSGCESSREIYLDGDAIVAAPTAENARLWMEGDASPWDPSSRHQALGLEVGDQEAKLAHIIMVKIFGRGRSHIQTQNPVHATLGNKTSYWQLPPHNVMQLSNPWRAASCRCLEWQRQRRSGREIVWMLEEREQGRKGGRGWERGLWLGETVRERTGDRVHRPATHLVLPHDLR